MATMNSLSTPDACILGFRSSGTRRDCPCCDCPCQLVCAHAGTVDVSLCVHAVRVDVIFCVCILCALMSACVCTCCDNYHLFVCLYCCVVPAGIDPSNCFWEHASL
jgi:hypothetical protein